jgi:DNA-binding protein H-NS
MPKSFTQIQQQIAKLQRQANEVRSREASAVIKRIQTAIEHYELTQQDLFGSAAANESRRPLSKRGSAKVSVPNGRAGKRGKTVKRPPVAVKFRDDEGNSWTGRGSQPRWLVAHLKSGRKIADFAVESR